MINAIVFNQNISLNVVRSRHIINTSLEVANQPSTSSRHVHGPSLCGCAAHWKVSSFRLFSRCCHRQLHAELVFCQNIRGSHQHPAAEASALFPLLTKKSEGAVLPEEVLVWILTLRELIKSPSHLNALLNVQESR